MAIVILGAGHAGGTAAALLRQNGYEGDITLVGDEPQIPYQRPPLSKGWLKGEVGDDGVQLRPAAFYEESRITVLTGVRALALHRSDKTVSLSDGQTLAYDQLIIATGARARRLTLPGSDLDGFLELRTIADAEAIKARLKPGFRLAIIGGGYVGLEVAASARALGAEVALLEREDRLLARVAGRDLSRFFQACHEAHGVRFYCSAQVEGFEGAGGHVAGVRLKDQPPVPCDAVLVGIGAAPNDEIALEAGLECAGGIVVDLQARTSDPSIFAIGDVAHRPLPLYDRMFRLESVPNALEQARQAAAAICGTPPPKPEIPWFWSDQYDLKLQIAGLPFEVDDVVVRGDPASRSFAAFHMAGQQVQAVEAVNAAPEFIVGRQMIGARREVDKARLADLTIPMKAV